MTSLIVLGISFIIFVSWVRRNWKKMDQEELKKQEEGRVSAEKKLEEYKRDPTFRDEYTDCYIVFYADNDWYRSQLFESRVNWRNTIEPSRYRARLELKNFYSQNFFVDIDENTYPTHQIKIAKVVTANEYWNKNDNTKT